MTIFQALILGIVQGLTEFLPVSSSGHLVIFPELFDWPLQDVAFDAVIHLATLLVILMYFRRDLADLVLRQRNLVTTIVLATIPVGIVGLVLERIEGVRSMPVVIVSTLAWGIVLMIADARATKRAQATSRIETVGWRRVFLVGLSQAIALIPGTSRSGITITIGLFAGLDRTMATRLAFLVGIPAIALAGLAKASDIISGSVELDLFPVIVGFFAAFVSGYVAVAVLMRLLKRIGYFWFGFYRVLLATFLFLIWMQSLV